MEFIWNENKAIINQAKHGVSFLEASTVFNDPDALFMGDPDHSEEEERFILLGMSAALRTLVVCHCYREDDEQIRIISARKATKNESETYRRRKITMRDEYDFNNAVKNPYTKADKTVVTIRLDTDVIEYFKALAANINLPYQTLINSYLLDCVREKKMPTISWK